MHSAQEGFTCININNSNNSNNNNNNNEECWRQAEVILRSQSSWEHPIHNEYHFDLKIKFPGYSLYTVV
jgi:hypothetical protein